MDVEAGEPAKTTRTTSRYGKGALVLSGSRSGFIVVVLKSL